MSETISIPRSPARTREAPDSRPNKGKAGPLARLSLAIGLAVASAGCPEEDAFLVDACPTADAAGDDVSGNRKDTSTVYDTATQKDTSSISNGGGGHPDVGGVVKYDIGNRGEYIPVDVGNEATTENPTETLYMLTQGPTVWAAIDANGSATDSSLQGFHNIGFQDFAPNHPIVVAVAIAALPGDTGSVAFNGDGKGTYNAYSVTADHGLFNPDGTPRPEAEAQLLAQAQAVYNNGGKVESFTTVNDALGSECPTLDEVIPGPNGENTLCGLDTDQTVHGEVKVSPEQQGPEMRVFIAVVKPKK